MRGGALGEDRGLGDVELQGSILKEYMFKSSQDLEGHTEFGLDVPIICISPGAPGT